MIMKYIPKIKSNISIYTIKKSSNILDGSYSSIFKGKTMNFEDLREYVIGDNIKDIDWKASARNNSLLVRQYIAEKKHNIMIVFDTGKKMLADTKSNENKKNVAIMSAGAIQYLAYKTGNYVTSMYSNGDKIEFYPFKTSLYNIEITLAKYNRDVQNIESSNLNRSLEYITKNIRKRMILFLVTDLEGMDSIKEDLLKRIAILNDIMIINISDAEFNGKNAYDIDSESYIPDIFLSDEKLHEIELEQKKEVFDRCMKKINKYKISATTIDSEKEIQNKIIELLERHRNANIS